MRIAAAILLALALAAGCAVAGGHLFLNHQIQKQVEATVASYKHIADIQYDNAAVSILDGKARVNGLRIIPPDDKAPLSIDEFILHSFRWGTCKPNQHHFEIKGIKALKNDLPLGAPLPVPGLDLTRTALDFECHYDYDKQAKTLDVHTIRLAGKNAGHLAIELHMANMDLSGISPNLLGMLFLRNRVLPQSELISAKLYYVDDSLMDSILRESPEGEGKTDKQVRDVLNRKMQQRIDSETSPEVIALFKEYQKFLINTDQLTIRVNPPQPVSLESIVKVASQEELIRALGLEVQA